MRLIVLLLVALFVTACDRQKPDVPQAPAADVQSGKGLDRSRKGKIAPTTAFNDPAGEETSIAAFKGTPVLVNLWATWCAPCVKELPTLEALEARQKGKLAVIAVSQDMTDKGSVDTFLEDKKFGRFAAYHDADMAMSSALGVQVLPTTILFDADGKEVWRFVGDLDWDGAEAKTLMAEVSPAVAR